MAKWDYWSVFFICRRLCSHLEDKFMLMWNKYFVENYRFTFPANMFRKPNYSDEDSPDILEDEKNIWEYIFKETMAAINKTELIDHKVNQIETDINSGDRIDYPKLSMTRSSPNRKLLDSAVIEKHYETTFNLPHVIESEEEDMKFGFNEAVSPPFTSHISEFGQFITQTPLPKYDIFNSFPFDSSYEIDKIAPRNSTSDDLIGNKWRKYTRDVVPNINPKKCQTSSKNEEDFSSQFLSHISSQPKFNNVIQEIDHQITQRRFPKYHMFNSFPSDSIYEIEKIAPRNTDTRQPGNYTRDVVSNNNANDFQTSLNTTSLNDVPEVILSKIAKNIEKEKLKACQLPIVQYNQQTSKETFQQFSEFKKPMSYENRNNQLCHNTTVSYCCFCRVKSENFIQFQCLHGFCIECLDRSFKKQIDVAVVHCPFKIHNYDCKYKLSFEEMLLTADILESLK